MSVHDTSFAAGAQSDSSFPGKFFLPVLGFVRFAGIFSKQRGLSVCFAVDKSGKTV
jgi:hypothetical protein